MKNNKIKIFNINVKCSCNNIFNIYTLTNKDLNIEICYKCHPFYTKKTKKYLDIGRIGKFNKKYKNFLF